MEDYLVGRNYAIFSNCSGRDLNVKTQLDRIFIALWEMVKNVNFFCSFQWYIHLMVFTRQHDQGHVPHSQCMLISSSLNIILGN